MIPEQSRGGGGGITDTLSRIRVVITQAKKLTAVTTTKMLENNWRKFCKLVLFLKKKCEEIKNRSIL